MARMTRRRFLKLLLTGTVAAVGSAGGVSLYVQSLLRGSLPNVVLATVDAEFDSFDEASTRAVAAMIEPIFINNPPADLNRYERYITWRANHVSLYRAQYTDAATSLNTRAQSLRRIDFADLDVPTRRALLAADIDTALSLTSPSIDMSTDAMTYIILDFVQYYLSTDGYLVAGYSGWPGMARGYQNFLNPIEPA